MIRVNLSEVNFYNDFFTVETAEGYTLVLNSVNEVVVKNEETEEINRINLQLQKGNEFIDCSSIIGISSKGVAIVSDYQEVIGTVLSMDNKDKCRIEIYG